MKKIFAVFVMLFPFFLNAQTDVKSLIREGKLSEELAFANPNYDLFFGLKGNLFRFKRNAVLVANLVTAMSVNDVFAPYINWFFAAVCYNAVFEPNILLTAQGAYKILKRPLDLELW